MEELRKLKRIIEKSRHFFLIFSQEKENDAAPAAVAFFYILKQMGKNAKIISPIPNKLAFLIQKTITPQDPSQAPLETTPLIEQTEAPIYLVFGITHFAELLPYFKTPPNILVNIDIPGPNENYGHLNLTSEEAPTLSELTLNIISFFDEGLFSKKVATALLSGLICGANHPPTIPLTIQTLQKVGFLIEQGAAIREIAENLCINEGAGEKSLLIFEKILSKLNVSERRNVGWALLEGSVFQEIGATIKDVPFTLEKLASGMFPFENFFLLWEHYNSPTPLEAAPLTGPTKIQGVFYSPEPEKLEKITLALNGTKKGGGVLFQTDESNLQFIKNKILELLELN